MIKQGVLAGFCAIFATIILLNRGISYASLSDAFAVPGVLLLCAAALLRLKAAGALSGILRLWRFRFRSAVPEKKQPKPPPNCTPFWITGIASLSLGLLFLILFYTI